MKLAAIFLAIALGGAAISSCEARPPYGKARLSTVALGVPGGSCSGTAVGRFTILTATHCVADGAMAVTVNGQLCEVWKIVNDGFDHALLTIGRKCPQKHIARMSRALPVAADELFMWGNPGAFNDLFRKATVAGNIETPAQVAGEMNKGKSRTILLVGHFGRGDSGAGVFNRAGDLVGVLSWGTNNFTYPPHLFAGMFPLGFTADEWPKR